ncbi:putative RNA-directed DNA polymerase from transposon BS [Trichonephila clavipes]|nr:putative RNA-directed DNA polymerase from transposon BS [Trichonephila clavipes]
MVSWEYLWPTLRCRRVAGVGPLLSIGWWYLSSVSPKRHCCRISAVPDYCQLTGTLPPLLDSVVGGGTPERRCLHVLIDPNMQCPGKGLVLPNSDIDAIAAYTRYFILSLQNNELNTKSSIAINKVLIGIGGERKSVKRLRSGDLLIETLTALQTNTFLLAKTFLNSPILISLHKSINSSRIVISGPDLLTTPEAELLDGFSDQGVIQVRRITLKKDNTNIPTKHLILTFKRPKLSFTIKAEYLNYKIRPYIPNPVHCFKCQRFGHSQTSCRGQLTCSRCASVEHSSTDCTLEPKCVNCTQSHPSDSKICPKWKLEKQIQEIKANKNISYPEARKLIIPQSYQPYAQAAKSSNKNSSTETDENITKIKCSPLKLLEPLSSKPKPNASISTPKVSRSSSSTQAQLTIHLFNNNCLLRVSTTYSNI